MTKHSKSPRISNNGPSSYGKEKKNNQIKDTDIVIETREKISSPTILIAYRENDLYKDLVPMLATALRSAGRKVEIQKFSVNADPNAIKEWAKANRQKIGGSQVINDRTFDESVRDEITYETRNAFERKHKRSTFINLDYACDAAADKIILGEWHGGEERRTSAGPELDFDLAKNGYCALLRKILAKKDNMPTSVSIFTKHILDHGPFYQIIKDSGLPAEGFDPDAEPSDKEFKLLEQAAEMIRKWLVESGIKAKSIRIVTSDLSDSIEAKTNVKGAWMIGDRHFIANVNGKDEIFSKTLTYPRKAKVLRIPFMEFYDDALAQKMLEADPNEVRRELCKIMIDWTKEMKR